MVSEQPFLQTRQTAFDNANPAGSPHSKEVSAASEQPEMPETRPVSIKDATQHGSAGLLQQQQQNGPEPPQSATDTLVCKQQALAYSEAAKAPGANFAKLLQDLDDCSQSPPPQTCTATPPGQQQLPPADQNMQPADCNPQHVNVSQMLRKVIESVQHTCEQGQSPDWQLPIHVQGGKHLSQDVFQPGQAPLSNPQQIRRKHLLQSGHEPKSCGSLTREQNLVRGKLHRAPVASKPEMLNRPQHALALGGVADCTLEQAMQHLDLSNIVFRGSPIVNPHIVPGPTTPAAFSWSNCSQQPQQQAQFGAPHQTFMSLQGALHDKHAYSQSRHFNTHAQAGPLEPAPAHQQSAAPATAAASSCLLPQTDAHWSPYMPQPPVLQDSHRGGQDTTDACAQPVSALPKAVDAATAVPGDAPAPACSGSMHPQMTHAAQGMAEQHASSQQLLQEEPSHRVAGGGTSPCHLHTHLSHVPLPGTTTHCMTSSYPPDITRPTQPEHLNTEQCKSVPAFAGTNRCMEGPASPSLICLANDPLAHDLGPNYADTSATDRDPTTPVLQIHGSSSHTDAQPKPALRTTSLSAASVPMIPVSSAPHQSDPAQLCEDRSPVDQSTDSSVFQSELPDTDCTGQLQLGAIIASASSVLAILNARATCLLTSPIALSPKTVTSEAQQLCHKVSAAFQQTPIIDSLIADDTASWNTDQHMLSIPSTEHANSVPSCKADVPTASGSGTSVCSQPLHPRRSHDTTEDTASSGSDWAPGNKDRSRHAPAPRRARCPDTVNEVQSGDFLSIPACLSAPCSASDVLQVAAILGGRTRFSLNDLYATCTAWADQHTHPDTGMPSWPGLAAAATLVSTNKSLAKQAIFSELSQNKLFLSCGHSEDGLQQWSLRATEGKKRAEQLTTTNDGHHRCPAGHQLSVQSLPALAEEQMHSQHRYRPSGESAPHGKSGQVKQVQMSKAASDSLSQHYRLAVAQQSQRKPSNRAAASLSSPHHKNRAFRLGRNSSSAIARSALPASVQAKVSHAMQKWLPNSSRSPVVTNCRSVKLAGIVSPVTASNLQTHETESQSALVPCPENLDMALSLQQQAIRVKARAEAVLHNIDWATDKANSMLERSPASGQESRQNSSATCSSSADVRQPAAQVTALRQPSGTLQKRHSTSSKATCAKYAGIQAPSRVGSRPIYKCC